MTTKWLDEREARAWRGFHRLRNELTAHLSRELAASSDLSEADYAVLVEVSEAPGRRLRARELGRALGWDRSRLSHQIARMEARGTVTREALPDDRRGFDVVLTDAGLTAIATAAPLHLATVRHCFVDVLSERELEAFARIAEKVVNHLATAHGPTD